MAEILRPARRLFVPSHWRVSRRNLQASLSAHKELLREARAVGAAAIDLGQLRTPKEVLAAATRIAAELASPPGQVGRRATYIRVRDGWAVIDAQYDETGTTVEAKFSVSDHPPLKRAVETGEAVNANFDHEHFGPDLRQVITSTGVTHGACVPIACTGQLVGVLAVGGRGQQIGSDLFQQLINLGHIVELALDNALAHQTLAELATTDELTGLANRRGFQQALAQVPDRRPFAVICGDVDGLKMVNDADGHHAGDALLVVVADVMRSAIRRGDLAARLGGDEFALLLRGADEQGAQRVADHILSTLGSTGLTEVSAAISLGIAIGGTDDDAEAIHRQADSAMYLAKRSGGMRSTFARPPGRVA